VFAKTITNEQAQKVTRGIIQPSVFNIWWFGHKKSPEKWATF